MSFPTKKQEIIGDIITGTVLLAVALGVIYAFVYICVSVPARNSCHAAGWMNQKVDMNFTRYCYSRIDGTDIIIPYNEAIGNGNFSNLYIRETFNQYAEGVTGSTETFK